MLSWYGLGRRPGGELNSLYGFRQMEIGVFGFCLNYMVLSGGLSGENMAWLSCLKIYLRKGVQRP